MVHFSILKKQDFKCKDSLEKTNIFGLFLSFLPIVKTLSSFHPTLIAAITRCYNFNRISFQHNSVSADTSGNNDVFYIKYKSYSFRRLLLFHHWAELNIARTIFSCVLPGGMFFFMNDQWSTSL